MNRSEVVEYIKDNLKERFEGVGIPAPSDQNFWISDYYSSVVASIGGAVAISNVAPTGQEEIDRYIDCLVLYFTGKVNSAIELGVKLNSIIFTQIPRYDTIENLVDTIKEDEEPALVPEEDVLIEEELIEEEDVFVEEEPISIKDPIKRPMIDISERIDREPPDSKVEGPSRPRINLDDRIYIGEPSHTEPLISHVSEEVNIEPTTKQILQGDEMNNIRIDSMVNETMSNIPEFSEPWSVEIITSSRALIEARIRYHISNGMNSFEIQRALLNEYSEYFSRMKNQAISDGAIDPETLEAVPSTKWWGQKMVTASAHPQGVTVQSGDDDAWTNEDILMAFAVELDERISDPDWAEFAINLLCNGGCDLEVYNSADTSPLVGLIRNEWEEHNEYSITYVAEYVARIYNGYIDENSAEGAREIPPESVDITAAISNGGEPKTDFDYYTSAGDTFRFALRDQNGPWSPSETEELTPKTKDEYSDTYAKIAGTGGQEVASQATTIRSPVVLNVTGLGALMYGTALGGSVGGKIGGTSVEAWRRIADTTLSDGQTTVMDVVGRMSGVGDDDLDDLSIDEALIGIGTVSIFDSIFDGNEYVSADTAQEVVNVYLGYMYDQISQNQNVYNALNDAYTSVSDREIIEADFTNIPMDDRDSFISFFSDLREFDRENVDQDTKYQIAAADRFLQDAIGAIDGGVFEDQPNVIEQWQSQFAESIEKDVESVTKWYGENPSTGEKTNEYGPEGYSGYRYPQVTADKISWSPGNLWEKYSPQYEQLRQFMNNVQSRKGDQSYNKHVLGHIVYNDGQETRVAQSISEVWEPGNIQIVEGTSGGIFGHTLGNATWPQENRFQRALQGMQGDKAQLIQSQETERQRYYASIEATFNNAAFLPDDVRNNAIQHFKRLVDTRFGEAVTAAQEQVQEWTRVYSKAGGGAASLAVYEITKGSISLRQAVIRAKKYLDKQSGYMFGMYPNGSREQMFLKASVDNVFPIVSDEIYSQSLDINPKKRIIERYIDEYLEEILAEVITNGAI